MSLPFAVRTPFTNQERNLLHLLTSPDPEIRAQGRDLLRTLLITQDALLDLIERMATFEMERQEREESLALVLRQERKSKEQAESERDAFGYVLLQIAGEEDSPLGTRTLLAPLNALHALERIARLLRREIKEKQLTRKL